jgi:hypothetical protein
MLIVFLLVEIGAVIFTAGLLAIAVSVTMRHGDPTATFELDAIRDRLIDSVVFQGVDREDPWFVALYENVNRVLLQTKLMVGPTGWPRAAASRQSRVNSMDRTEVQPLPSSLETCPEPIRAITPELRAALEHLLRNHAGIGIYMTAQERRRRRLQQETAETLLRMMTSVYREPAAG